MKWQKLESPHWNHPQVIRSQYRALGHLPDNTERWYLINGSSYMRKIVLNGGVPVNAHHPPMV